MSDLSIPLNVAVPVGTALVAAVAAMWRRMTTVEDRADKRISETEEAYSERVGRLQDELAKMRDELRTEIKKSAGALLLARDALASRVPEHSEHVHEVSREDAEDSTEVSAGVLPIARAQIEKMARAEIARNQREREQLLKAYVDSDPLPPPRQRMPSKPR